MNENSNNKSRTKFRKFLNDCITLYFFK